MVSGHCLKFLLFLGRLVDEFEAEGGWGGDGPMKRLLGISFFGTFDILLVLVSNFVIYFGFWQTTVSVLDI